MAKMNLKDEKMLMLNQMINNKTASQDEYYSSIFAILSEIRGNFKTFSLTLTMEKIVDKRACDGYCYDKNCPKIEMKNLIVFSEHSNHMYCWPCFQAWVYECINKNPNHPIVCQRCERVNKPNKFIIPETIIFQYQVITPEELNYKRANFVDQEIFANCLIGNEIVNRFASLSFLCGDFYCDYHRELLISNTLDSYYNYLADPNSDLNNFYFILSCECGREIAKNNTAKNYLEQWLQNSQFIGNPRVYLEFIQKYYNFIMFGAKLIRCNLCKQVYECTSEVMTCMVCGICMTCNKLVHPGMTCDQYRDIKNEYVIDMGKKIAPPPPGENNSILQDFTKISLKVESSINQPKRVELIWKVTNQYMEYMFQFGKEKKNILSEGYTEADALNVLKNGGFQIDSTYDMVVFPVKSNWKEECKFYFYCEVNYDQSIKDDPKTAKLSGGSIIFVEFMNKYMVSCEIGIRILFLVKLGN